MTRKRKVAPSMPDPLDPTQRGSSAEELLEDLTHMVVGQREAVESVVDTYQMQLAGLCPSERPLGSFLFLGPTGTGKTRLVESLAHLVYGDPQSLLKVDCAEFQHGHEIAKLIGSPPGYLGHRETHPMLSQVALNKHHTASCKISFILFDEIEKASDALWNLLLGILDRASMTLGDNTRVSFSRAMIFLTSNLGSKELARLTERGVGFAPPIGATAEASSKVGVEAARKRFTPEFLNRLDQIVTFHSLGPAELREVLELEIGRVHQRIMAASVLDNTAPRFLLSVSQPMKDRLIQEGTDGRYGARFLKRTIERLLMRPIANLITSGQIQDGDTLSVTCDAQTGKPLFYKGVEGAVA